MDYKREKMLNGNMYKVILTLAFPIMINNLIQTLYNLIDGVWVSKLGSVPFAATSFVWPVNFLFVSIGMGFAVAGTALLSQLIGGGEKEQAEKYASQLIVLSVLAGVVLSAIGIILSPHIIRWMGGSGELAYYGNIYLRITMMDMAFMLFFSIFNAIMNAQGNTVLPTALGGISAIMNAILDPIMIFTLDMGVAGAAVATLICKIILAIIGGWILLSGKRSVIKPNFKNFKFDKEIIIKSVNVAAPSALGQSGSAIGFMVLNACIASYGTATIAAFGMVNRITSLVSQPAMGIGAALVAIIGQNLGANQLVRVKEAVKKSFMMTVIICVFGCIILLWQDKLIINFFMQSKDDPEVIKQGIIYLRYISLSMPLMGIFSVLQGVFQGSSYTKYSMYMEIGRLWCVRLPLIWIFKHFTQIGSEGIWFAMSFSNLIICIYGFMLYKKGKWQTGKISLKKNKKEVSMGQ